MTRHYLLITLQLLLVIYIKLLLLLKAIMHASLLLGNGVMIFPCPTAMKHVMWPLMNHYSDCGVIESKLVVNEYCCYYMS